MAKTGLTLRTVKGSNLTFAEADANFTRLMYYSGAWAAGTHTVHEAVTHDYMLWIANKTTTLEPAIGSADWDQLSNPVQYQPMSWAGAWSAGTYKENRVVSHASKLWVANQLTSTEPGVGAGATEWDQMI